MRPSPAALRILWEFEWEYYVEGIGHEFKWEFDEDFIRIFMGTLMDIQMGVFIAI